MAELKEQMMDRAKLLRGRKEDLAKRVLAMDATRQQAKPADGGFTPAELVAHLNQTEAFNLVFLKKSPPPSLATRSVKPGFFYHFVYKKFLAFERTPAPPMLKPSKSPDAIAESARLSQSLDHIDSYLGQVTDPQAAFIKMNFLFGTLSATQYIDFQEAHTAYHEKFFPAV